VDFGLGPDERFGVDIVPQPVLSLGRARHAFQLGPLIRRQNNSGRLKDAAHALNHVSCGRTNLLIIAIRVGIVVPIGAVLFVLWSMT